MDFDQYCVQRPSAVTFEPLAQTELTSMVYTASSCQLETDDGLPYPSRARAGLNPEPVKSF